MPPIVTGWLGSINNKEVQLLENSFAFWTDTVNTEITIYTSGKKFLVLVAQ